ncbi:MAG TPA: hypothetical protein G4O06_03080 [Dehalococcoidia bacterium]|nr:hypothetical protein [Dehalococcoidia bacterium]
MRAIETLFKNGHFWWSWGDDKQNLQAFIHPNTITIIAKRFKTFDEVMDAFRRQLEHNVKMAADAVNTKDAIYRAESPAPFVSASPPI